MAKQFTQINYEWYKLMHQHNLNMIDINLLGIISGLQKSTCGCIADDSYFENILQTSNININLKRLEQANIINVKNGKIRKITVNKNIV